MKTNSGKTDTVKDFRQHWNKKYIKTPDEELGWYETELTPTLKLISETCLDKSSRILIVGAGTTMLIDKLLESGYKNLIATDISEVALDKLKSRVGNERVQYIIDDLINPVKLKNIDPVDLWIDRAVLHFFIEEKNRETYFKLLKNTIRKNGYALMAQFNLSGADTCSGLLIYKYDEKILAAKLGKNFKLVSHFNYIYTMPSGDKRPYIYTLFKKVKN